MKTLRTNYISILALAALFGLLAYAGITLTRGGGRIAMLWLPNAVVAAFLLRSRTKAITPYIVACFIANVAANRLVGDPWVMATGLAMANAIEVISVVLLMRRARGNWPGLAEINTQIWIFLAAFLGSALSASIASLVLASTSQGFILESWTRWIIADGLSLLIILPIIIVLIDAIRYRKRPSNAALLEWVSMIALVAAGNTFVFAQSTYPFLFLSAPLVVYAAFRTGLLGVAIAMLLTTLIASIATTLGHGPITLVRGGPEGQLIAFQTFLAANFLIGFPVASLLAQRAADRASLRDERDEKQEVLDNIRDIIFRTDSAGRWTSLNPAWEKLTGYPVEESLGRPTTQLLHPDDFSEAKDIYARIVSGEINEATLQQRFLDRWDVCHHIEVGVRRLSAPDGSFNGTIGNIRDISTQVRQERELAESEARFRKLAEAAPVGIFRANAEGELTYINPSWAVKVGKSVEQMLGHGWLDAVADRESLKQRPPFQGFSPGELRRRDIQFRGANGQGLWMETYNSAEFDEDGEIKGYYGAAVDVSEARELEANLRRARSKAEEAAIAKSAFLANMSHEIRTPMNGVIGSTELLQTTNLDDAQRGFVQMIADSGREMMRLLNDILDISKIEAGQLRVVSETVNLLETLTGIVNLMSPVAGKKGLYLDLNISPHLPEYIMSDQLRLRQVILNLVGNAIKFTEVGGIQVSCSQTGEGNTLRMEVTDTGIGIAEEDQQAIFQQFTQADGSIVRRFGGTGLGLSISNQLINLMGGRISVSSAPGKGATFAIEIPLVAADAPAPSSQSLPSITTARSTEGALPRLLIAEDNPINQELIMAMALKAGCSPSLVADGEAAIHAIDEAESAGEPFALVLMDLQMPVMDGLSATRAVRANGYTDTKLPIVALTANAYQEDIAKCLAAGMQAHLAKPLRIADLSEVIAKFAVTRAEPSDEGNEQYRETAGIPGLAEKYEARKDSLRALLADLDRSNIDERWRELEGALHQLAGVAAYFGEAKLGETASALEHKLRSEGRTEARLALADDALIALNLTA